MDKVDMIDGSFASRSPRSKHATELSELQALSDKALSDKALAVSNRHLNKLHPHHRID